jgi:manganese transport protein
VKVNVAKAVADDVSDSALLLNHASDMGADVLVMGAHGHKLLKDLVFGATVDAVRHAVEIPVLVVR